MKYVQEPPFAIQVELVEGCNLHCDFCGIWGVQEKQGKGFKFATVETMIRIADEIERSGWNSRIEFAMHGEPTWNPIYIQTIRLFRKRLPKHQLMMTSNGGGLLRSPGPVQNLVDLFNAGLNVYAFDAYESVTIKDKVMPALELSMKESVAFGEDLGFELRYYPDEPDASPHNRWGHNARVFIRVKDISVAEKGTHSILNNHAGSGAPPNKNAWGKRCAKPFRELSFRWDGNVAICCNTWPGSYKIGSIHEKSIEEIWRSEEFDAARKFLVTGDRKSIPTCAGCDAVSYRVGLLPDKKGKVKLPKPTDRDREIVKRAESGDPYSVPLARPWGKGK